MIFAMDKLCAAIIDMACFLELSGSDVVDEHAAVAAMETLGNVAGRDLLGKTGVCRRLPSPS